MASHFATMQARRRKASVAACEGGIDSRLDAWQSSDRMPATPQRRYTRPPVPAATPPSFDMEPLPLPAANLPFDADAVSLLAAEAEFGRRRSRLQDAAEVVVVEEPSPMSCRGGQQPPSLSSLGGKPIVEGMLLKRPGGFRGWFGNTAWRERHFRLDSRLGVFEYWYDAEARYAGSSPRRSLLLSNLEAVEQLEDRLLSLNFAEAGGGRRVVQVRVPETGNFSIWVSTLMDAVNSS